MKPRTVILIVLILAAGIGAIFWPASPPPQENSGPGISRRKPDPPKTVSPLERQHSANRNAGTVSPPPEEPKPVLTPEEEEKEALKHASTMYKWMCAYALDQGGTFPSDTSELLYKNRYGFVPEMAGEYLTSVIEYRGARLANSDHGALVLMRYRIGDRTDKEVWVRVSGSVTVVPAGTPIPEDQPPSAPATQ